MECLASRHHRVKAVTCSALAGGQGKRLLLCVALASSSGSASESFLWPQTLQNEILGHAPRVEDVLQRGRQLVEAAEIDCQDIEERLGRLQGSWDTLREAAAGRLQRLRDAHEAQQYYLDAGEAEAWISEQELYVFSDEPPKVRWSRGG